MLVMHGLWADGALLCWAEDARAAALPSSRRGGRPPKVRAHPFAASAAVLHTVLPAHALPGPGNAPASKGRDGTATVLLPTLRAAPLPSPELPIDAPARAGADRPTAALWQVPVVRLRPGAVHAALAAELPENAVAAAGWRHLRELALFADDLAGRGRVLPTVDPANICAATGGGAATATATATAPPRPRARWAPVLTGADAAWARSLALGAPAALAAAIADGSSRPAAPRDVVAAILDQLVDAASRRRLEATGRRPGAERQQIPERAGAARGAAATSAAWMRALLDADPAFDATPADVARLAADLAGWQRDALGRPTRARFRLVEPPEIVEPVVVPRAAADDGQSGADAQPRADALPAAPWRLEFALQATREPSIVVGADQVWAADGATGALNRFVASPREALLAELGRAQRLVPSLAEALRTARPTALELDAPGAHAFLREGAATLSAAGFGVEVPGWWGRPAARLGARLTAGTPSQPGSAGGAAGLGQAALVNYQWEVALGDHNLTLAELKALAELQQPLVRLRGQWVEVDAQGLQRALKALQRNGSGQMSVAEIFGALAAGDLGPGGLPVLDVQAEGWLGDLLSGSVERRLEPIAAPADFGGTLRPYQERGLAWLAFLDQLGLGAVLADDMGLGKTVQLLALIARDRAAGPTADRTQPPSLLVCPMSLVGNWQREAARFVPDLRVHVHHGADRARGEAFEAAVASSDLVVTTYAIAARDVAALGAIGWRRVVLDEAQAVKNAATKQAAAVRALPAAHRIAVTGTPVENRLADLWSIMEFANPGLLGGATAFRDRFAVPIERHGDDDAAARLRTLTQPFVLRRLKTDRSIITDLPEKLEMDVFCSLTTEQAALYQATVDDMIEKIEASDGIERRGLVLATMTKLKQVCNHPAQLLRDGSRLAGRSGKLARVEETLEEVLAAGEKALLFTQFAEFGGMLRAHLSARFGREVLFLHGGVAKADRDTMVARFCADDESSPPLFVLSLKAGGTGLNLTAANHVLHVDRWWNPAVEDQATDRAFRIGQRRAVQVRKLVCAGTVEERIAEMIREKRGLAARIVGTGEGWLTELSTSQLRELLRLDRSAVPE
jgi:hypothetical protein